MQNPQALAEELATKAIQALIRKIENNQVSPRELIELLKLFKTTHSISLPPAHTKALIETAFKLAKKGS